jgi:TetR/AcrR family transcriptional repressor of lmrAB and yxaGH operons
LISEADRVAPAQKHREGLIGASLSLFQRQGYAGTGLAEILAESGAPRGSLYHYFPDGKEQIAEAALRQAAAATELRIRNAAKRIGNPAKFAIAYGNTVAETMERSGFARGCPVATVALEAWPASPKLTAASCEAFALWSAALADMLRDAGIPQPRAAELADFMIATMEGAMILARVRQSTTPVLQAAAQIARVFETELTTKDTRHE